MNVRDRSGESFGGSVQQLGHLHLKTSDAAVAAAPGRISGEGATQGNPEIPTDKPYPEVATIEQSGESCTAEGAAHGGPVGPGSIKQGDPAEKAIQPATAYISGGRMVEKTISVTSHPQLSSAHRHGSITKKDHNEIHQQPVTATPVNQSPVRSR